MNRTNEFGGIIGFGDSLLDFIFCHSKLNRQHEILNDAAPAVRLDTGRGPCYFYMIGRGPNGCLLGHVTATIVFTKNSFEDPFSILTTFREACFCIVSDSLPIDTLSTN